MTNKLNDILDSWANGRNVLLYGPPATGKTRLISDLFQALNSPPEGEQGIQLDPHDTEIPFSRPSLEIVIPQPTKVIWTTFHQSYGYEDFVLGLRPEISAEGTRLKPSAGVFLDAALELYDPDSPYSSVVIFIDEINRGNAARIFGEFMTFLDFDYRDGGRVPLPLPLRQLSYQHSLSEEIYRQNGKIAQIPEFFCFPEHIYIVATMNSVDRAAVPIDSALARRFDRIEVRPDVNILAALWGLETESIPKPDESNCENLTPFETAYLLLDRLNLHISSMLGSEFELGHGLLTSLVVHQIVGEESIPVDENEVWRKLAVVWDEVLYPQLEDRFSGRPEYLLEILRVDSPPQHLEYAWELRSSRNGTFIARALAPVRTSELDIETIKRSFRWLTL